MNKKHISILLFFISISLGLPVSAENKNIFSFKTGSFSIDNKSQTIGTSPFVFDTDSTGIFAFEYERLLKNNISVGAGFITYANDIVSGSSTSSSATSIHVMAIGKKYFAMTNNILPYLGVGFGTGTSTIDGIGFGPALQGMVGIKFRAKNVSLLIEYRAVSATVEDIDDEKLDVSGDGVFGGVSFSF